MEQEVNIKQVVDYWKTEAERNYETAEFLYKGKKYSDCLFFCHLMLEKILKGLVVKQTKIHAPYIHELDTLVIRTNLDLNEEQMRQLKIINTFNIRARYDNIKKSFYQRCDKNYTEEYFNISKELYLWLKKEYQKK
ncbi:MAG: HEPN domain-containing protein [Candidatus Pacebacteria bacterium]|nr:HEPN domain-containing protein [Candidatus Paceibacterota bacterium]